MKLLVVVSYIFLPAIAFTQSSFRSSSSFFTGFQAYKKMSDEPLSFIHQQASLSRLKSISTAMYSERKFMMEELSSLRIGLAIPTTSGNFGLGLYYDGNNQLNQLQLGLAYGRSLGDRISIGAQFNYYRLTAAGYGSGSALNVEAGALFYVNNQVTVGLHFSNPTSSKLNKGDNEEIPGVYSVGLGYKPSEKLLLAAELVQQEEEGINVNAAMEYLFADNLSARVGVKSATESYMFGLGVGLKNIKLHAITYLHPHLGVTPGLMISYRGKQETND